MTQTLFGNIDPIGKEVVVAGRTFTVIGVFEKQKTAFGGGKNPADSYAYFTIPTFRKLHPLEILDYWISAKFDDQKNKALVMDEIRELLRRRRKVRNEQADTFAIFSSDSITKLWNQITGSLFLLMFGLSGSGPDGGWRRRDEYHAGKRDGTNARDWRAQGDWRDQADDSAAVYAGGDCAVRGGWGDWDFGRVDDCNGAEVLDFVPGESAVGAGGVSMLVRNWVGVWNISGVEGGEFESDRGIAVRVEMGRG